MPSLVLHVESSELREHLRLVVGSLLGGGARRQLRGSDRGMRVEDCPLVFHWELVDERPCAHERVGLERELLDEARPSLEELRELPGAQLPR